MSVLRSETLISNPDTTIRRREHKWFRITTLRYNLCHTLKIRLLPLTAGLQIDIFDWIILSSVRDVFKQRTSMKEWLIHHY